MEAIFSIILMFIDSYAAKKQGYNEFWWFLAAGPLGGLVLMLLPNLEKSQLSPKEKLSKQKIGDFLGFGISLFAVAVIHVLLNETSNDMDFLILIPIIFVALAIPDRNKIFGATRIHIWLFGIIRAIIALIVPVLLSLLFTSKY